VRLGIGVAHRRKSKGNVIWRISNGRKCTRVCFMLHPLWNAGGTTHTRPDTEHQKSIRRSDHHEYKEEWLPADKQSASTAGDIRIAGVTDE